MRSVKLLPKDHKIILFYIKVERKKYLLDKCFVITLDTQVQDFSYLDTFVFVLGSFSFLKFDWFKLTVKKNETGCRIKPENLRFWTIPIRHLSDVPVSRNWHNYTKTDICQILYKSCSIKQIIFNNYAKSENDYVPQEPENLRFAHIIFFYFAFSISNRYNW